MKSRARDPSASQYHSPQVDLTSVAEMRYTSDSAFPCIHSYIRYIHAVGYCYLLLIIIHLRFGVFAKFSEIKIWNSKFQFQNSKSSNFRIWNLLLDDEAKVSLMQRKCCQCCVHAEADTKLDGARSHIWKGTHAALKTSISSYRKTLWAAQLVSDQ